ncbi:nucleotidyltransferase family protein [Plantactinospora sp. CA-290183]|uniref:nucleotidyltransferase family protein n=1 Tax=Plantactinospora sp. CA-290183 TaxID=3240006 RepID=UPI003D9130CD
MPGAQDEERLRGLIRDCSWLTRVLATVRDSGLPDAWVGAGAIRDLVWGEFYGSGFDPGGVRDVDVVFFDPDDLGRDRDALATARLHESWPQVPWEARNQAAVHVWYAGKFGGRPVEPLLSIADAVATWPETATAVAVRLDRAGAVEICAPLGLTDLLAGVWRRNPRRASLSVSLARLARHRPAQRWPGVRVVPPI